MWSRYVFIIYNQALTYKGVKELWKVNKLVHHEPLYKHHNDQVFPVGAVLFPVGQTNAEKTSCFTNLKLERIIQCSGFNVARETIYFRNNQKN